MNINLASLNPQFLIYARCDGIVYHEHVSSLDKAHGIRFLCPKCYVANNGPVGTHGVICWFVGKVPDTAEPGPGRWTPNGTGIHDLSFVPGTPARATSVALTGGCAWHGHIENGICTNA